MTWTAIEHRCQEARSRPAVPVDFAVAVAVFVVSVLLLSHTTGVRSGAEDLDLVGVVLAAGSSLPLAARRKLPVEVFVVTSTAAVLLAGFGYLFGLALGPALALLFLAASRDQESPWPRPIIVLVIVFVVAYLAAGISNARELLATDVMHASLPWVAAWFAGERSRLRRLHIAELHQRAEAAERDAHRERQLAVAEERGRIARDLHDSAGHAINVIAVKAGAARMGHGRDPDRSLSALASIEALAQRTAADIDHIVRTVRDSAADDGVEPPAGLASLNSLIEDHDSAGLVVTLEACGPETPLGGAADQAVYRILQEALTNAARHGTGRTHITFTYCDSAVEVTVTNPVAIPDPSRSGGGHGLIGMRERASLLGGSLDTERDNGTFRVTARIPYGAHTT